MCEYMNYMIIVPNWQLHDKYALRMGTGMNSSTPIPEVMTHVRGLVCPSLSSPPPSSLPLPLSQEASNDPVEEEEDRETGSEGNKATADTSDGDADPSYSKDEGR